MADVQAELRRQIARLRDTAWLDATIEELKEKGLVEDGGEKGLVLVQARSRAEIIQDRPALNQTPTL
jgi:hypothetical protein